MYARPVEGAISTKIGFEVTLCLLTERVVMMHIALLSSCEA